MNKKQLARIVRDLRASKTDTQFVEVKESVEKLPASIVETISAFANGSGGVIILGLSERNGFTPAEGFDARRIADALSQACSDKLTPPVRADIEIFEFEGSNIVVATVEEIPPRDKPCYVTAKGLYRGSYIRSFDGDRKLTPYEIDRLLEDKTQPAHDAEIVPDATMEDLDKKLYNAVIQRQKELHPRVFLNYSDEEIALALRIAATDNEGTLRPTLGGLLALGTYPQKFFPRLTVTFAAYPEDDKASPSGTKFLDSQKLIGPIPALIADTVAAVQKNSRLGGVMEGAKRVDVPDYPAAAVREAICNSLMHRDYSALARGTQVQVNLYEDRLEFLSPGGLYGTVTADTIGTSGYSSTRNQHLADILESTPYEGGFVAENRGTGFKLMNLELKNNQMEPPVVRDSISMFVLEFRRNTNLAGLGARQGAEAGERGAGIGAASPTATSKPMPNSSDILQFVTEHEPCGAAEISAELGIPRSTVTYRLKNLLEKGQLVRLGAERSRSQKYALPGHNEEP